MRILLTVLALLVCSTAFADPLIKANHLVYKGAFRLPIGDYGSPQWTGFSYGGSAIATSNSSTLYMTGALQQNLVAEVSIPTPLIPNSDLSNLNYATVLQNFADITEGNRYKVGAGGGIPNDGTEVYIGGLLTYGSKLIGTSYTFYSTLGALSHFTSGLTLSTTGDFGGMYAVGSQPSTPTASFVSGYMTKVPTALQSSLGGPALTGNGSLSVISRTSYGPAAFSFDPARLGLDNPVAATPLLYYPQAHQTLGSSTTSSVWNDTTKMAGMVMVNGSRSVLYFGYHGIGPRDYGEWSADPIFADTCRAPDTCVTGPKGWPVCTDPNNCTTGRKGIPNDPLCAGGGTDGCYYDPTGIGSKGPHAFPYIYKVWAYDADELAAVKSGTKNPWDVLPYAQWSLPFDVAPTSLFGGAAAYDAATGRVYVVQPQGDTIGNYKMPLVHVFELNLAASTAASYKIRARVMLLKGNITLRNNGTDTVAVSAGSRATTQTVEFASGIAPAGSYNVTIASQPTGQTCSVLHGSGTVDANADVDNIVVTCEGSGSQPVQPPTTTRSLNGRLSGSFH